MSRLFTNCYAMATKCTFCNIAQGKDQNATILFENEKIVVFRDIRPAATHHYLAIPKEHIRDASRLKKEHVELVNELISVGKQVLEEQGGNMKKARTGFHWPPACSEYHLHLHIISPHDRIKFKYKICMTYNPKRRSFKTVDDVIDRLKAMPDDKIEGQL